MTSYNVTESSSRRPAMEIGGWNRASYAAMNQWDQPRAEIHDDLAEVRVLDWFSLHLELPNIVRMQEISHVADLIEDDNQDTWINRIALVSIQRDETFMMSESGFSISNDRIDRAYANALIYSTNLHANMLFNSESALNRERAEQNRSQYKERIKHLLELAKEEEDLELNQQSQEDFWLFINSIPLIRKGGLVLLDNGDLRALWKDDDGARIGLQFRGAGEVEYVIFSRSLPAREEKHQYGRGNFDLVKNQIREYNLWSLVSE